MNNRRRRVERLRRKYETPSERRTRNIIQAFINFRQESAAALRKIKIR